MVVIDLTTPPGSPHPLDDDEVVEVRPSDALRNAPSRRELKAQATELGIDISIYREKAEILDAIRAAGGPPDDSRTAQGTFMLGECSVFHLVSPFL